MTPQERQHLIGLIHAAFDLAREQGIEPPIDLGPFGLMLREIEPGFSHLPYGHDKLLYLLRGEFHDLLHIRKDNEAVPPRYSVSIRHGSTLALRVSRPRPPQLPSLKAADPGLVNGTVLERFLDRLAESSATIQHRFNDIDRRLVGIRGELDQSRANEVRLHSHTQGLEKKTEELERNLKRLNLDSSASGLKSEAGKKTGSIYGDFSRHHYLKWEVGSGSRVIYGQAIASVHYDKDLDVCMAIILADVEGKISQMNYPNGSKLSGSSVLIGYIDPKNK